MYRFKVNLTYAKQGRVGYGYATREIRVNQPSEIYQRIATLDVLTLWRREIAEEEGVREEDIFNLRVSDLVGINCAVGIYKIKERGNEIWQRQ